MRKSKGPSGRLRNLRANGCRGRCGAGGAPAQNPPRSEHWPAIVKTKRLSDQRTRHLRQLREKLCKRRNVIETDLQHLDEPSYATRPESEIDQTQRFNHINSTRFERGLIVAKGRSRNKGCAEDENLSDCHIFPLKWLFWHQKGAFKTDIGLAKRCLSRNINVLMRSDPNSKC